MIHFPALFVPKILPDESGQAIWLRPNSVFGASMAIKLTYNNFQKPNSNSFLDKSREQPQNEMNLRC